MPMVSIAICHLEQQSVCYAVHFILLQMRHIIMSVTWQMNANLFCIFCFFKFLLTMICKLQVTYIPILCMQSAL